MPKATGPHRQNRLTDKFIRAVDRPGRYADGHGLYLQVYNKSAKHWLLRITVQGRRRDLGLGSVHSVTLAEARDLAWQYRRVARAGLDPVAELRDIDRHKERKTFEERAREYHANVIVKKGKNAKHVTQWLSTLERFAFPVIGSKSAREITSSHLLEILLPIWNTTKETANRLRQRINTVLDYAKAKGDYSGESPMVAANPLLKRDKSEKRKVKHHRSLDYKELPEFVRWLRDVEAPSMGRLALEFTILTAARTSETTLAKWDEIDLDKRLWTVPAERMKMDEEHRVPLTDRAVEILETVRPITEPGGWIFEGQRPRHHMSNMTMAVLLKKNDIAGTVHGMRATFRTWAAEKTSAPRAVCERCLSHRPEGDVELSYQRSDLLDLRKPLMEKWSTYCGSAMPGSSNVVPLAGKR